MNRVPNWLVYVVLGCAALGFVIGFSSNPIAYSIPLVLAAIIFIFYRLGPKRTTSHPRVKKSAATEAKMKAMRNAKHTKNVKNHKPIKTRRSSASLTVIDGNKGKNSSSHSIEKSSTGETQ
ncbi:hypothetical protein [Paenibacillus agilis]|uniref:Uncharacterized protein n=1 Tax=Paenibacillus agilis TaxID=3020863 RepID=A0A559IYV6_9BACL|nr:hypothetical protein [Paenibacillus agilis]TVX92777.1 hypothetical protein FPZ44_06750 [Paenibacillus agilis]